MAETYGDKYLMGGVCAQYMDTIVTQWHEMGILQGKVTTVTVTVTTRGLRAPLKLFLLSGARLRRPRRSSCSISWCSSRRKTLSRPALPWTTSGGRATAAAARSSSGAIIIN
eukprot:5818511-Pyramimonas_sp.AAC.2